MAVAVPASACKGSHGWVAQFAARRQQKYRRNFKPLMIKPTVQPVVEPPKEEKQ